MKTRMKEFRAKYDMTQKHLARTVDNNKLEKYNMGGSKK